MPKATAVFDADDSRLSAALASINAQMLALQSRIAKFAGAANRCGLPAAVVFAPKSPPQGLFLGILDQYTIGEA